MRGIVFEEDYSLANAFTFRDSKAKPCYNWFYFKEAFAPEFAEYAIQRFGVKPNQKILDPFCGVGTTLLAAKQMGLASAGVDASLLCVLASRVKTRNYDEASRESLTAAFKRVCKAKFSFPKEDWRFELFDPRRALPRGSFDEAIHLRKQIRETEPSEAREFLALALASALPEASLVVKDGGVLKIRRGKGNRHLPSLRQAFERRAKRMLKDLSNQVKGPTPEVLIGDARQLPFGGESFDAVITSPPYLNGVDYSKIYGLELSLLFGENAALDYRSQALRSFVGRDARIERENEDAAVAERCLRASDSEIENGIPDIAAAYLTDMTRVFRETKRVLKAGGGRAAFVVGNAVLPGAYVAVDEVLALIALELGFADARVVVGAERFADVDSVRGAERRRVRESAVLLEK